MYVYKCIIISCIYLYNVMCDVIDFMNIVSWSDMYTCVLLSVQVNICISKKSGKNIYVCIYIKRTHTPV